MKAKRRKRKRDGLDLAMWMEQAAARLPGFAILAKRTDDGWSCSASCVIEGDVHCEAASALGHADAAIGAIRRTIDAARASVSP